jgi:hypothetical protein
MGCVTTHIHDAGRQGLETIRSARPDDDFRTPLSEQQRSRLADSTAGARDRDHLAIDSRHQDFPLRSPAPHHWGGPVLRAKRRALM